MKADMGSRDRREPLQREVSTEGGSYIEGDVDAAGGDVIGRDKVIHGDEVYGDKVSGDKLSIGEFTITYYPIKLKAPPS